MSAGRRLLGVSWCMPPALFPRSIQVARLLKGLRFLGWSSTIVTPRIECLRVGDTIDPGLAEMYVGEYALATVDLRRPDPDRDPFTQRLASWLRGDDGLAEEALWVSRASRAAGTAIGQVRPSALVTFAQPWCDHVVGLAVRRRHPRLPWVAHFSDPWVDSLYADGQNPQRSVDVKMEAAVVEQADRIVFTNQYAADLVMKKYPAAWAAKARVVPHAMDQLVTSQPAVDHARRARLRLSHVGNLFVGRRTANALFDALAVLKTRRPLASELEVVFLGDGSGLYEARERVFVQQLEDVVTFGGRVSYRDSLSQMHEADVLMLIDAPAETNVFLPSKVVDYLMADRPILALTPEHGATADLMRQCRHLVVPPADAARIAAALESLLQQRVDGRLPRPAPGCAMPFALDATSRAFAAVLSEAIGGRL